MKQRNKILIATTLAISASIIGSQHHAIAQTATNVCNNGKVDSSCVGPDAQTYTPVNTCNNPYACTTNTSQKT